MKILIIMDPGILVPPKGYGGHERLVFLFAKEYNRLGHDVDLLVTKGSVVEGCKTYSIGEEGFPPTKKEMNKALIRAWRFLWANRNKYDLIHNFGRLSYLLPVLNSPVKKIMTYGREISRRNILYFTRLPNKNLIFTGCSMDLVSRGKIAGSWEAIYNAIDFSKYTIQEKIKEDAPLMFLGRIERVKGCHTAIAIAKATNHCLIIAGNISPLAEEKAYFDNEIKPHIDGEQIFYIGTVNDEQKNQYLGKAKALLFPIEWNEPFGIVMIEAMACGTPVIGFKYGSVTEVIEDGITGYKVENFDQMLVAVNQVDLIDRKTCRTEAQRRFDSPVITAQYLGLFK